jgi:hypothetical protein
MADGRVSSAEVRAARGVFVGRRGERRQTASLWRAAGTRPPRAIGLHALTRERLGPRPSPDARLRGLAATRSRVYAGQRPVRTLSVAVRVTDGIDAVRHGHIADSGFAACITRWCFRRSEAISGY